MIAHSRPKSESLGSPAQGRPAGFFQPGLVSLYVVVLALLFVCPVLSAQTSGAPSDPAQTDAAQSDSSKDEPAPDSDGTSRVRIEVTGGDPKKPVGEASVYLKFTEVRTILRDRRVEFNLKTNQNGIARSPQIPQGRVLIQIVAPGWKTFGRYYEINRADQVIQVQLERPTTRWF
jgi:hypothetical protein